MSHRLEPGYLEAREEFVRRADARELEPVGVKTLLMAILFTLAILYAIALVILPGDTGAIERVMTAPISGPTYSR